MKGIARPVIEENMLADRVYSDYRYRTTGICVCVMILAIGIYMIRSAGRQRKRMQAEIQKRL